VRLPFDKVEAAGNDFILVATDPGVARSIEICDRHHGLGADGVMVFRGGGEDVILDHYDCDGSRSFCLNGVRAALRCLVATGRIAAAGTVSSEGMRLPYATREETSLILPHRQVRARRWRDRIDGFLVDAGNPQFVIRDLPSGADFLVCARSIRNDLETFPEGVNVNHLVPADNDWSVATFERGVEGLTLSCGSGIYACAMVLIAAGERGPFRFRPAGRGSVVVTPLAEGVRFEGTTRHVAEGVLLC